MATIAMRPSLGELYKFIAKIQDYPISVRQLIEKAHDLKAPDEVVDFYKKFDRNQVFKDEGDLTDRSEVVDILRAEEAEMPPDDQTVPTED